MPRSRLLLALLAATTVAAGTPAVKVVEHGGRWESGYGAKFYNVVGKLENEGTSALRWVKLRIDALDDHGKVVASTDAYNETAEILVVPEVTPEDAAKTGKLKPFAPGTTQRFRGSFLAEETPPFATYRVVVVDAPVAPD
jgi:hypothetical protein